MAEKMLKKVEDQLNCSICLDTYTNPKLLQCFHTYCQKCLVKLVVRDQQGQLTLTCPICRQVTPVPANGVAGFQSAFHINHLLEIMDEHKKTVDPSASVEDVSKSFTSCSKIIVCPEHDGKEVELYCETCKELICLKCVTRGGKHQNHDHELVDEAFERYKGEITSSLEPMEKQLTTTNKTLEQLDTHCGQISDQQKAIEASIQNTVKRLHEILDVRKTELVNKLHQITQRKLKDLAAQTDQVETTQAQISSCLHFMKESLRTGSRKEVLMMKASILKQVKELTSPFKPDMSKPNTEANISFSVSDNFAAECQKYGQLAVLDTPDPSMCHIAAGQSVKEAVVEEKSKVVFQANNFKGQPCEELIESVDCELVSEKTGTRVREEDSASMKSATSPL